GKVFGEADRDPLTYTVTSGSLAFTDTLEGEQDRDPGEDVGDYAINQDTLTVVDGNSGNNYDITYISNDFSITAGALSTPVSVFLLEFFENVLQATCESTHTAGTTK
ncbi:MAG: hypothetical protein IIA62_09730, partial [Nitrospinae bacterium]|nr:hypothetical protein [Nitrospinota bacterium]